MSLIDVDNEQRWVPTHVQVTVVRGRGLRAKGKHGASDIYAIIQVGKEKFTTAVVEKTTTPEWNEECSFELLPGVLEAEGRSAYPPGSSDLLLTVMHRALIGLDVFLGQVVIPLDNVFHDRICPKNEWYKLHSKSGKKEKERGELQLTVQFTRNNLTASMYDLSSKDKPRSTFDRLKDRVRGKKRGNVDSASANVPAGYAILGGTGGQIPGHGGRDEDAENGEGGVPRTGKMKSFFLKGKLQQKSADTRSSTSLESSVSTSPGGGLSPTASHSMVVSDLSNSPSDSSPVHTSQPSPRLMTHKRAFSDEASKVTAFLPRPRAVETLRAQSVVLSQSSLCINGSHVYPGEPVSQPGRLGLLDRCSPLSRSLQNLTRRSDDTGRASTGGRRWSFDRSGKEDKTEPAADHEPMGVPPTQPDPARPGEGKKQKKNLFSHGRSDWAGKSQDGAGVPLGQAALPAEERHRGWFGSKDPQNKPSLEVSPKVETSAGVPSHLLPSSPSPLSSSLPPASTLSPALAPCTPHREPFIPSPVTPPMSPSNPFFNRLQSNPFFEELIADQAPKPSPPVPCRSSSFLWPPAASPSRHSAPSPALQKENAACRRERPVGVARQRSLPEFLPGAPSLASDTPRGACVGHAVSESSSEWDESFQAFASSRLKLPKSPTPQSPLTLRTNTVLMERSTGGVLEETTAKGGQVPTGNIPPLPPRRPGRSLVQELGRDSWLAGKKEACLLFPTDTASMQHRAGGEQRRAEPSFDTHGSASLPQGYPAAGRGPAQHKGSVEITAGEAVQRSWSENVNSDLHACTLEPTEGDFRERSIDNSHVMSGKDEASLIDLRRTKKLDDCHTESATATSQLIATLSAHKLSEVNLQELSEVNLEEIRIVPAMALEALPELPATIQQSSKSNVEINALPGQNLEFASKGHFTGCMSEPPGNAAEIQSLDLDFSGTEKSLEATSSSSFEKKWTQSGILAQGEMTSLPVSTPVDDLLPGCSKARPPKEQKVVIREGGVLSSRSPVLSCDTLDGLCHNRDRKGRTSPPPSLNDLFHGNHREERDTFFVMAVLADTRKQPESPECRSPAQGLHSLAEAVDILGAQLLHPLPKANGNDDETVPVEADVYGSLIENPSCSLKASLPDGPEIFCTPRNDSEIFGTPPNDSGCNQQNINQPPSKIHRPSNESLPDGQYNDEDCNLKLEDTRLRKKLNEKGPWPYCDIHCSGKDCNQSCKTHQSSEFHDMLVGDKKDLPKIREEIPSHGLGECQLPTPVAAAEEQTEVNTSLLPLPSSTISPNVETDLRPGELYSPLNKNKELESCQPSPTLPSSHSRKPIFGSDHKVRLVEPTHSECTREISFGELHTKVAPDWRSQPKIKTASVSPLHAFAPSLVAETNALPYSAIPSPVTVRPTAGRTQTTVPSSTPQPMIGATHPVLPEETHLASSVQSQHESSPHPVKPLSTTAPQGEKKSEGRSVLASGLEKLKSTIHGGRAIPPPEPARERNQATTHYQRLTHPELIALLVQKDAELERQGAEFERQGALLEKREVELKKMKMQVRDLEDYIDRLLVRIMEQTPTLLQVRSRYK